MTVYSVTGLHKVGSQDSEECQTQGQADSGGPLVCRTELRQRRWHLVGAVSWGADCSHHKETPGVYAGIVNLRSWIVDTITFYQ